MPRSEQQSFLKALCATQAVIIGHILFPNGDHGNVGINPGMLYPHTAETSFLCRGMAERFRYNNVETVISLTTAGNAALSQWTAHHLSEMCNREVFAVSAEEEKRPRGFFGMLSPGRNGRLVTNISHRAFVTGKNVLVVGDFLTTGEEARKLIETVRTDGGKVIGVGVLSNCARVLPKDLAKIPKLVALTSLELNSWSKGRCPICLRAEKEMANKRNRLPSKRK